MTRPAEFWNSVYENDDDIPPWVIGAPQPAIVQLLEEGQVRGRVLEPGCGAGEHTILMTRLGYDVIGTDLAASALAHGRRKAAAEGVPATRFEVADALRLTERTDWAGDPPGSAPVFDTVVDSALFHVFATDAQARAAYVAGLHAVVKSGGLVHILALSDTEPGIGPRISDSLIRDAFGAGWELEELAPARYRGRLTAEEAAELGRTPADTIADFAAWRARFRRLGVSATA